MRMLFCCLFLFSACFTPPKKNVKIKKPPANREQETVSGKKKNKISNPHTMPPYEDLCENIDCDERNRVIEQKFLEDLNVENQWFENYYQGFDNK